MKLFLHRLAGQNEIPLDVECRENIYLVLSPDRPGPLDELAQLLELQMLGDVLVDSLELPHRIKDLLFEVYNTIDDLFVSQPDVFELEAVVFQQHSLLFADVGVGVHLFNDPKAVFLHGFIKLVFRGQFQRLQLLVTGLQFVLVDEEQDLAALRHKVVDEHLGRVLDYFTFGQIPPLQVSSRSN